MLGEKNDGDFVLLKKLKIPKFSRPESGKIDEETKTYVEMVCTNLRNIKTFGVESVPNEKQFIERTKKKF